MLKMMKGSISSSMTTAMALPYPGRKLVKDSQNMLNPKIRVAPLGPPWVMIITKSKTFRTVTIMVVTTTMMVGQINRTLIRQNTCHGVAPSIRAASRISVSRARSAADRITMQKPVQIHTAAAISAKFAKSTRPSQAMGSNPDQMPVCAAFRDPMLGSGL